MAAIRGAVLPLGLATAAVLLVGCTAAPTNGGIPSASPSVTADACAGLTLAAGEALNGPALGACVENRMTAAGSYRATGVVSNSKPRTSTALVELAPLRISLTTDDEDDPHALIVAGDSSWGQFGEEWVSSASDDPRAPQVLPLMLLTVTSYSADSVSSLLASVPSWNVVGQQDGGWMLQPASDPTLLGVTLTDASLIVGEDWLPIRSTATGTFDDQPTTTVQDYSDWGATLDFPTLPAG